jgi:hypothetical protein
MNNEFQIGDILIRENEYYLVVDKTYVTYTIRNLNGGNECVLAKLLFVRHDGYYQKVF